MATAPMPFKSCKHCNDCDDLLKEIQRRMESTETGGDKGLLTRWADQIYGCQTPLNTVSSHPSCAGHKLVGNWTGHNKSITTQKGRVKTASRTTTITGVVTKWGIQLPQKHI